MDAAFSRLIEALTQVAEALEIVADALDGKESVPPKPISIPEPKPLDTI